MTEIELECPHCKEEIEYSWISRKFHAGDWDWQTEFKMNCPHCDGWIEVQVESIPEFVFSKL